MPWPGSTSQQRPANKITVMSCKGKVGSASSVSDPLEGAGRIPEAEGGWSLHPLLPPSSSPAQLALFPSFYAHSFHEMGMGGKEKGEGEVSGAPVQQLGGLRGLGELREPCRATLLARPSACLCAHGAGREILDIALVRAESIIEKMRVHYRFWPWSACLGRRLG